MILGHILKCQLTQCHLGAKKQWPISRVKGINCKNAQRHKRDRGTVLTVSPAYDLNMYGKSNKDRENWEGKLEVNGNSFIYLFIYCYLISMHIYYDCCYLNFTYI